MREVGALFHCCLCDSIFVLVVKYIDLQAYSGAKRKELLNIYEEQQKRIYDLVWQNRKINLKQLKYRSCFFFRCPTCVQYATGKTYLDWLENFQDHEIMYESPCRFVNFENDPTPNTDRRKNNFLADFHYLPLYMNMANSEEKKPKWELCSGVGPQSLILDKTIGANIIYKPAMRDIFENHMDINSCEMYCGMVKEEKETKRRKEVVKQKEKIPDDSNRNRFQLFIEEHRFRLDWAYKTIQKILIFLSNEEKERNDFEDETVEDQLIASLDLFFRFSPFFAEENWEKISKTQLFPNSVIFN